VDLFTLFWFFVGLFVMVQSKSKDNKKAGLNHKAKIGICFTLLSVSRLFKENTQVGDHDASPKKGSTRLNSMNKLNPVDSHGAVVFAV
jgi:hypothetical protein